MRVKSIEVSNFLSLQNTKLDCSGLTTLVGPNGVGKSNFLRALSVFYSLSEAKSLVPEKWFLGETRDPIEITVEFIGLRKQEEELLKKYVKNGTLKVTLRASIDHNTAQVKISYHGRYPQNPSIHEFRNTKFPSASAKKEAYIRLLTHLPDLPSWTSSPAADEAVGEWEEKHQDQCVDLEDDGNFFGFKEVGNGNLKAYTRFLHLPAVKDASEDATEGSGSLLSEIADIVKTKIKASPKLKMLEEEFRNNYGQLLRSESSGEMEAVNSILSQEIKRFLPNFRVDVGWGEPEAKTQLSKMGARLIETGMETFPLPLEQQGHGVQRVYILSILKVVNELRKEQITVSPADSMSAIPELQPDLIIGIEEPELYQHPIQQRRLYKIFKEMSCQLGEDRSIQILYSTHSPSFIEVEDFENIRLLSKSDKKTSVGIIPKEKVIERLALAFGEDPRSYTLPGLDARLQNIMNSIVNEGFFAKQLVLVEGFSDCIFVDWLVENTGKRGEFDQLGIAVLPVFGKNNLPKPLVVFQEIGIKTYFIFDGDRNKSAGKREMESNAKTNRALMQIGGVEPSDFPETMICRQLACFENTLETEMEKRLGKSFVDGCLDELRTDYGFDREAAMKNPILMKRFYDLAKTRGADFRFFETIVNEILL
jgi:putative ATP-dependent endonuclease of OLD family